ncbi:MAG: thiamine phosphate synthase [Acidobacteriota bacterium]
MPSAIYPITDPQQAGAPSHAALAKALLDGGARWLQLRDKTRSAAELLEDYRRAGRLARIRGGRVIVNDRADLALAAGAAGVHLGEEDLPAGAARLVLGPKAWIGVSTHCPEAAERAAALPVDYVALGPIYPSPSKPAAHAPLGLAGLRQARVRVAAPLVAIGGISAQTLPDVLRAGADAVALISEVCRAPEGAQARMRSLLRQARAVLAERPLRGRHLYLVGFMGAGKSTIGPILARAMGRPFVDLDPEVERRAGASIAELFATRGERHFRVLERRALARASRGRDAVIALGGGALGDAANRARVRGTGLSVWLQAALALLRERCRSAGAPERPLFGNQGALRRLHRARRPLYAAADLRLRTAGRDPRVLAERILRWIEGGQG